MANNDIAAAAVITWAKFGVTFDKHEETTEQLTLWISVPESSYHTDADGNEMAGMYLAKRLKTVFSEMGVKRLKILAKVRANDNWTKEKADNAEEQARKRLFGSQW